MPPEIVEMKDPIRHNFSISHRSGRSVEDLVIEFKSSSARITDIVITTGEQGAQSDITVNGREAVLKKNQLIPHSDIEGYVETEGLAALRMNTAAREGSRYITGSGTKSSRFDTEDIVVISMLTTFVLAFTFLLYKSIPFIKQTGIMQSYSERPGLGYVVGLICLLYLVPDRGTLPDLSTLFTGLMLFFLLPTTALLLRHFQLSRMIVDEV